VGIISDEAYKVKYFRVNVKEIIENKPIFESQVPYG